jgi:hypothetical protein
MTPRKRKKRYTKNGLEWSKATIYLNEQDERMLEELKRIYGLNYSALIRHLITEVYSILTYVEQNK